jgi:GntR family transcriptional regulator
VIEFRLDRSSGRSTYWQLAELVRQALRLGLLGPGDQLPTVREVVASIAVNPNAVLKAYRELEREGVAQGRLGQGTFVLRSLSLASPADQHRLRRRLAAWIAEARIAGLDQDGIGHWSTRSWGRVPTRLRASHDETGCPRGERAREAISGYLGLAGHRPLPRTPAPQFRYELMNPTLARRQRRRRLLRQLVGGPQRPIGRVSDMPQIQEWADSRPRRSGRTGTSGSLRTPIGNRPPSGGSGGVRKQREA